MPIVPQPDSVVRRLVTFFATGFGLGYSPIASGTVGSLWGLVIVWGMTHLNMPAWLYAFSCLVLILLAIPVCTIAEGSFGGKDDGRIVADEFMCFPVCMMGLPFSLEYAWLTVVAFGTFRFFDIVKIPPARQCERLPGGAGIVLDDAVAAVYSLITNWMVYLLVLQIIPA